MIILATVVSGFLTITLLFFRATRKTYPGFDQWTAGVGFLTLGYVLFCLRGFVPDAVSILIGNVAFPLGMVLHLDGIRRFLGMSAMSRIWYAVPGIDLLAIALLYYLHDSPAWRSMATAAAMAVPHWAMAAIIFRHPVKRQSMLYPVIGSFIGLAGVVVLVKATGALLLPQWHLLANSAFQLGIMPLLIVLQLGENLSLIILNSERVENELGKAEVELRSTIDRLQEALAEQKRTDEFLRESEERYRTFFDTSRDCVFMTTVDGRFIYFNDAGMEMLGYSASDRQDMLSKNVATFYADPEERDAHSQRVQALGFSKDYPVDLRKKDGTIIHALVTTVARKGSDGTVIGFQGTVRDITELKKAENALKESEQRLRLAQDAAKAGTWEWDLQTNENFWSDELWPLYGLEPHSCEPSYESWLRTICPADRAMAQQAVQEAASQGRELNAEWRTNNSGEGSRWLMSRGQPVYDEDGQLRRYIGIVIDITDRKRAHELALQSGHLRAIADLSAGVSHHFNNLLQIIMGSASLSLVDLEDGKLSNIRIGLEKIVQAARLGADTVRRLQTFADLRPNIAEEEATTFDVTATVRNVVEISRPLWSAEPKKSGAEVKLSLDLEEGCLVQGKENEILEALVNLIINAVEAMPEGGELGLKAARETGEVVIEVSDTGMGIPEENLSRIFQPFWSSKGVSIGKGMGLAVTHGLVKRHGGTMSVVSRGGEGTTFTMRLPLAQEPVMRTPEPSVPTRRTWAYLTILLMEDELPIATLIERMLRNAGHRVFMTLSGEEGLAVFRKEKVELVICDLGMPGMSGWDVGKAIRSICREKGIPKPHFILLTGWGGQELEEEKIAESGTDAILAKPIDSAALLAAVQERAIVGPRLQGADGHSMHE